jgi:hypothetical protein
LIVTEIKPLAKGGSKDSHVPVVPAGSTPEPRSVRVFSPDMAFDAKTGKLVPCRSECLSFSLPEWEAADRVRRSEAVWKNTGKKKRRGIQIVARTNAPKEHTLAAQLSEWQEKIAKEHPELWVTNDGLATLEQVAGLPVVGKETGAIKLFYGPKQEAA